MNAPLESQDLLDLAQRRRQCVARLCQIAQAQFPLIEQGDMPRLFEILAAKSRELETLGQIDKRLAPLRSNEPSAVAWTSQELRDECNRYLEESEKLLKQVIDLDKQSEATLQTRKKEFAQQLQIVSDAQNVCAAYDANQSGGGSFNLSSEA